MADLRIGLGYSGIVALLLALYICGKSGIYEYLLELKSELETVYLASPIAIFIQSSRLIWTCFLTDISRILNVSGRRYSFLISKAGLYPSGYLNHEQQLRPEGQNYSCIDTCQWFSLGVQACNWDDCTDWEMEETQAT